MTIDINGSKCEVVLRMGAYLVYQDIFKKDFSEEKVSDTAFMRLMYAAYTNELILSGAEVGIDVTQFFNLISQDDYLKFCEEEIYPQLKKNMTFQRRMMEM